MKKNRRKVVKIKKIAQLLQKITAHNERRLFFFLIFAP